jgi:hypothetical protein
MISRLYQGLETVLAWLLNPFFFRARNVIRFRRKKSFCDASVALSSLPQYAQDQLKSPRHEYLAAKYGLQVYQEHLSYSSLYGAYFFLDVLKQSHDLVPWNLGRASHVRVLDVGTKNFDAAPALYRFFKKLESDDMSRKVEITGIEIDAFRVYRSLYSRFDVGQFFKNLITVPAGEETHRYLPGDFIHHEDKYDAITCFFPFVTSFALLAWGLPNSKLSPKRFVDHLMASLAPGGTAIILNQTEQERDLQVKILSEGKHSFSSHEIKLNFREKQPVAYLHVLRKEQ